MVAERTENTDMCITNKLLRRLVTTETGCQEFVGARNNKGYGNIVIEGQYKKAHRLAYEYHKGPIPEGMHVLHKCDNPPCCNPEHLFLGSNLDNVIDSTNKNRRANQVGSNNGNRVLNEASVKEIRRLYELETKPVELSNLFNVSVSCIRFIVNRQTWKHVE
jgi:hypothetical protein